VLQKKKALFLSRQNNNQGNGMKTSVLKQESFFAFDFDCSKRCLKKQYIHTMNTYFANLKESVLQLFYPHICAGCGTDSLPVDSSLCIKCLYDLPVTGFEKFENNPVEKLFLGRAEINIATAQLYFAKHYLMQTLMHQFKYKGHKKLGHQLGMIMGNQLQESNRFSNIELLIPLPLYVAKERIRGYNQSEILCQGISEMMNIPVVVDAVKRISATDSQTKKNRLQRWQNMEGRFVITNEEKIKNKKLLLVDDVITTGATLESCTLALKSVSGVEVNIATLCFSSHF